MTDSPDRLQDLPRRPIETHLSSPLFSDCIESLGHEPMALALGLRPKPNDSFREYSVSPTRRALVCSKADNRHGSPHSTSCNADTLVNP